MLTDDDISDQDWGTVSATADKLYANNSPMSSKRSQSFGSGSLPSPPEPKRPRHDSTEPPDCNPLDDTKALTEKLISVETMSFEEMVSCIMTMGTQGVDQSLRGKKKKPAYYVVWVGRDWGIYTQWDECKSQVHEVKGGQQKGRINYTEAVNLFKEKLLEKNAEDLRKQLKLKLETKLDKLYDELCEQACVEQRPSAAPDNAAATWPSDHDSKPILQPEYVLCKEQREAMDLAEEGYNLFITGSGGCGKSVLVKALERKLRAMRKKVYLIAPTGQAAVNIGGRTLFSFAAWVPDDSKKPIAELKEKSHRAKVAKRFIAADVLVIDEISMVENQCFNRLSEVMREVRQASTDGEIRKNAHKPFGGVQVIVVGDFCQLPPVDPFKHCTECSRAMEKEYDKKTKETVSFSCPEGHGRFMEHEKWAFKSSEWEKCKFKYVHLTQIHRQQDEQFIRVLQKSRLGKELDNSDVDLLLNHEPVEVDDGVRLFSLITSVDGYNERKFEELPSLPVQYPCLDFNRKPLRASPNEDDAYDYFPYQRYSDLLELKVNMPVMLLANIDLQSGLCNGSQGIICRFVPGSLVPLPDPPQSDNYVDDPDGFNIAMERYLNINRFMRAPGTPDEFPEVKFHNGRSCIIGPDCAVNQVGHERPYTLVSRTQIPLAAGWAITIHKSQGMSLDRVIVNLDNIFAKGQAYVALSRARSLRGLKVEGTNREKLRRAMKIDPTVKKFMDQLEAEIKLARAGTSIQWSEN